MRKRQWTSINVFEEEILSMRTGGKTRQEIADELGLSKRQIKDWICRYNRRVASTGSGLPKQRGRKAAVSLQEYKYENKRLKMENEVLRDFLHRAGRK